MNIALTHYTRDHRQELDDLLHSPEWETVVRSGLVQVVKAERIEPGIPRNFVDTVVDQLVDFNEARVRELIAQGCRDADRLFSQLSEWPDRLAGNDPIISFLGLNVTASCNFQPKCLYCNQSFMEPSVRLEGWKRIIREVTASANGEGPYIYITGGEPLLLGQDMWGDDGLVRYAAERGAAVNVNTNATLITPAVALRLVKSGLARLHISLDTADRDLQDYLCGGVHYDGILRGIYNLQLARDLIGVGHPIIHINCVLTNKNIDGFPQLLSFILEKHKQTVNGDDPFYNDLFPHIIPVGGDSNAHLRPSENEFRKFYESAWPRACRIWDDYQERFGVASGDSAPLGGFFSNPFLRVEHKGGLDAYVKASAEGRYGRLALAERCYVAPTQASFTPDGYQYRCGSHAIRRILPIGNIHDRGICDSIREGMSGLGELPQEERCYGCALATLYINQTAQSKLREKIDDMLSE